MNIKKPLLLAAICFISYQPNTMAQHVLPVFTGQWTWDLYAAPISCPAKDGCENATADCSLQMTVKADTNVATALSKLFSQYLKVKCECQLNEFDTEYPPRFFQGNYNEWMDKMQSHPEQYPPDYYIDSDPAGAYCRCGKADEWWLADTKIHPIYRCPAGSSPGWDDDGSYGCTTTPICLADVVGRDTKNNALLGQVALVNNGWDRLTVLEALDDAKPAVQENPFTSFKKADTFWGVKYDLPTHRLTIDDASNIIENAKSLQYCSIVEYSVMPNKLHPCEYDAETGQNKTVVRNDYFVNYVYQKADLKILDFGATTTPEKLFIAMAYCRYTVSPACILSANNLFTNYFSNRPFQPLAWYLDEQEISKLFAQVTVDTYTAGVALARYALVQELPRKEKINFLWSLALKYQNDAKKFDYLIDGLSYFNPVELTDELIQQFQTQTNLRAKQRLLTTLADLRSTAAITTYKKENLIDLADINISKIQQVFANLLFHSQDLEILEHVILNYPFNHEKTQLDIDQALQRTDFDTAKLKQQLWANPSFLSAQLTRVFSSPSMQQHYVAVLLAEVEKMDAAKIALFNDTLYFFFKGDGAQNAGYDSSKIDDAIRPLLLQYLEKHKPAPFNLANLSWSERKNNALRYNWLVTYMSILSHRDSEKDQRIINYLKSLNNPLEKSLYLMPWTDQKILAAFTTQELLDLRNTLTSLNSPRDFKNFLAKNNATKLNNEQIMLLRHEAIDRVSTLNWLLKKRN